MTRNVRTYDHFCLVARALERVGDRWSLLVIRDLLTGAKRFTDLMDRLGGITPKTLSQRLRELQDAGIVAADREPGRRWLRVLGVIPPRRSIRSVNLLAPVRRSRMTSRLHRSPTRSRARATRQEWS